MNSIVFILFAAVSPLVSADKYSFTIPNITNNIRGRVMGPNGDYSVVRSEDIAFIWEAIRERDVIAENRSYPVRGVDSYVPRSINLTPPIVGSWYTNTVVFIDNRIDLSDGPGKAAWDEGGPRMAAVTENYADLDIKGLMLNGVYSTNEIRRMYSDLNKYTVCGTYHKSSFLGSNVNVNLERNVDIWYEFDDRSKTWSMSTNSYDRTASSTNQASMSFYAYTDIFKELHRSFDGTSYTEWRENSGSPYTCVSGSSYKQNPSRLDFFVSLYIPSDADTKNFSGRHRVGMSAEVFVKWSLLSYDRGWRRVCENGESRSENFDYEPERSVSCLSKFSGSYYGIDGSGCVVFKFTIEDFDSEIVDIASDYGVSAVWDAYVPDPVTPTPGPEVYPATDYNINSAEGRKKLVMVYGSVCYMVIHPELSTIVQ